MTEISEQGGRDILKYKVESLADQSSFTVNNLLSQMKAIKPHLASETQFFTGLTERESRIVIARLVGARNKYLADVLNLTNDNVADAYRDGWNKTKKNLSAYQEAKDLGLQEQHARVYMNLSKLERQVYVLYLGNKTVREIAESLGKEPEHISKALQRIKAKIN